MIVLVVMEAILNYNLGPQVPAYVLTLLLIHQLFRKLAAVAQVTVLIVGEHVRVILGM